MQLTKREGDAVLRASPAEPRKRWLAGLILAALGAVFALDRFTAGAPVQHLYYVPIVLAGWAFGFPGGIISAATAIALYHLANFASLRAGYQESDIVQIVLFLAIGLAAAKMANDAKTLRRLATTDDLTGLHSLRSFELKLVAAAAQCQKDHKPLSLLSLDLDRLKELNDRYGHMAGAEAVRAAGGVLAARLPPDAVACRYGGDEFAVAIPGVSAQQARQIGQDLIDAIGSAEPFLIGRRWPAGTLSASAGVACMYPLGASAAEHSAECVTLFTEADEALYQAKKAGRNRVCSIQQDSSGHGGTAGYRAGAESNTAAVVFDRGDSGITLDVRTESGQDSERPAAGS